MIPEVRQQLRAVLDVTFDCGLEGGIDTSKMRSADRIDQRCGTAHRSRLPGTIHRAARRSLSVSARRELAPSANGKEWHPQPLGVWVR